MIQPYDPTLDSVKQHQVPAWYHDAKLGIFIHWGLYSVPGWAPVTGTLHEMIEKEGFSAFFAKNPYAEWYLNSLRFPDSPTRRYHDETYGEDFTYEQFVALFNEAIQKWDPQAWAGLFHDINARYVVITTKHHDGFLLWDSPNTAPNRPGYKASRDIVRELTEAVREKGLRMGYYYSGGLDWSFNDERIDEYEKVYTTIVQSDAFIRYSTGHWRELIDKYKPALMWNDIGFPRDGDLGALFAHYYNAVPEGVINDRFGQHVPEAYQAGSEVVVNPRPEHYDFITPEYSSFKEIKPEKWETCRGIGFSFGYNRAENESSYMSAQEAIRSFVDVVSKNGNLLLNVGPTAEGEIPALQEACLRGLGAWLDVNGEAIFETRPWQRAETATTDGVEVRFTQKPGAVYATLLDTPASEAVTLEALNLGDGGQVELLGHDGPLDWRKDGDQLHVMLPPDTPPAAAYTLKLTGSVSA